MKPIEQAARDLCRKRGIDPDALVSHGADPDPQTGTVPMVLLHSPAWTRAAREIQEWRDMQEASGA